jgi:hypothetical protein
MQIFHSTLERTYEQDTKWLLHILTRLMRVLFSVLNRSMAFTYYVYHNTNLLPDFFLSLTAVWEKKRGIKEVLDEVRKEPWRCKRIAERWNFSRGLAGDGAWVPADRGNGTRGGGLVSEETLNWERYVKRSPGYWLFYPVLCCVVLWDKRTGPLRCELQIQRRIGHPQRT